MLLSIPPELDDDAELLAAVSGMVAGIVEIRKPALVHIVRIRDAFDHKWLRYSGRGRVPFEGGLRIHTALDPLWEDNLTFPPFSPTRVISETSYERESRSRYLQRSPAYCVHRPIREHSARNLHRRIASTKPSSLFLWMSSGSRLSSRATIMVYEMFAGSELAWFASLRDGSRGWHVDRSKGIDRLVLAERLPGFAPRTEPSSNRVAFAFITPLLVRCAKAFSNRRKAIGHKTTSFALSHELEADEVERLNVDLVASGCELRLSIWSDASLWFSAGQRGPNRKGGWRFLLAFHGSIGDVSVDKIVKLLEQSLSRLDHDPANAVDGLLALWRDVEPVVERAVRGKGQ